MNIVYVEIQNMLGLTEAKLEPGKVTLIEGKNGAGKSATIDAIIAAFSSKGIDGQLVTQGANKGRVYLKLDDGHTIKASFTPDGKKTVAVTTPEGDTKKAPQTWLDGLLGAQVVNPVQFLQMSTADKRKVLLSALPIKVTQDDLTEWFGEALPIDTDKHGLEVMGDAEKLYYERRKNTNSEAKSLQSELDVVTKDIPADFNAAEWESVDTSSLTQQLQDIGRVEAEKAGMVQQSVQVIHNAAKSRQAAEASCQKIESITNDIAQLHERIKQLQEQIEAYDSLIVYEGDERGVQLAYAADLDAEAAKLLQDAEAIEVPDKSAIEAKLADYSRAQRTLQQIINRERLQKEVNEVVAKAEVLNAKVELARQKPKDLLAQAEFPIEWLEFSEDDILVNGLSIDSLSDGEKLKLGVAIAKAGTGPLGFIVIDGAELLDPDNLKQLMADAKADKDHHYVITRVTGGELTVTTEVDEPAQDERQMALIGEE